MPNLILLTNSITAIMLSASEGSWLVTLSFLSQPTAELEEM